MDIQHADNFYVNVIVRNTAYTCEFSEFINEYFKDYSVGITINMSCVYTMWIYSSDKNIRVYAVKKIDAWWFEITTVNNKIINICTKQN